MSNIGLSSSLPSVDELQGCKSDSDCPKFRRVFSSVSGRSVYSCETVGTVVTEVTVVTVLIVVSVVTVVTVVTRVFSSLSGRSIVKNSDCRDHGFICDSRDSYSSDNSGTSD